MTADVVGFITSLEYAGTALRHANLDYVLWLTRGLDSSALVRGEDDIVPHRAGRTPRSRVADVRIIELEGWVLAHGDTVAEHVANYRASLEELRALFDPALAPRTLSAVLEDGSLATIEARTLSYVATGRVAGHVAELAVQLESVDPEWVIEPEAS